MESENQKRDENLFTRGQENDFSSGPLVPASDESSQEEDEELSDEFLDEEDD